jgi:hypothetical protein
MFYFLKKSVFLKRSHGYKINLLQHFNDNGTNVIITDTYISLTVSQEYSMPVIDLPVFYVHSIPR